MPSSDRMWDVKGIPRFVVKVVHRMIQSYQHQRPSEISLHLHRDDHIYLSYRNIATRQEHMCRLERSSFIVWTFESCKKFTTCFLLWCLYSVAGSSMCIETSSGFSVQSQDIQPQSPGCIFWPACVSCLPCIECQFKRSPWVKGPFHTLSPWHTYIRTHGFWCHVAPTNHGVGWVGTVWPYEFTARGNSGRRVHSRDTDTLTSETVWHTEVWKLQTKLFLGSEYREANNFKEAISLTDTLWKKELLRNLHRNIKLAFSCVILSFLWMSSNTH